MLNKTFFTIKTKSDIVDNEITYRISLNPSHPIFKAHFAGNPVMPGACIVQMVKELAEDCSGVVFFVCAVKNVKFLNAINPLENAEINVKLDCVNNENGSFSFSALISESNTIFSKAVVTCTKK